MAFRQAESFDPGTHLSAWILAEWPSIPAEGHIRFLHAIPVHPAELEWKLGRGIEELLSSLGELMDWPGLDLDRPSVEAPT